MCVCVCVCRGYNTHLCLSGRVILGTVNLSTLRYLGSSIFLDQNILTAYFVPITFGLVRHPCSQFTLIVNVERGKEEIINKKVPTNSQQSSDYITLKLNMSHDEWFFKNGWDCMPWSFCKIHFNSTYIYTFICTDVCI